MEQHELQDIWENILAEARQSLSEAACKQWFSPLVPLGLSQNQLVLGVSSDFAKEWIETHFLTKLREAASAVTGIPCDVALKVLPKKAEPQQGEAQPAEKPTPAAAGEDEEGPQLFVDDAPSPASAEKSPAAQTGENLQVIAPGDASSLNPRYTFDTFVTGSSNQLAAAAAQGVAKDPGRVYNPLFMYGGVGLGKTHLMHAIGNRVLKNHPDMRVLYVSSEKFMNEMIDSIRDRTMNKFRAKYRKIDVLMIDDIQFLSGKESTQTEFFNTFNELKDAEKAIVLSSDRQPRELEQLTERLRSRFEGGLIADIQPPDFEMRVGILRNKAQMEHYDVPDTVLNYIANHIDSNIRELEGALTRVVVYADLMKKPITTDLAAEALKDILPDAKKREVTPERIEETVAAYFHVKVDDLHAKKRSRSIAFPRQIAMYLCCELTDTSLPQIGEFFGGRDHTTVMHARDKIKRESQSDQKLHKTLSDLSSQLQL